MRSRKFKLKIFNSLFKLMSLSNLKFPEENPFYRIKVRQIFLYFVFVTVGIAIQLGIISSIFKFKLDDIDPVFNNLLYILIEILTGALLLRQCNLVGINIKQLVGKIPSHYSWLSLVGLVIARVLFSRGVFRLSYYPVSLIAPSFVEGFLNDSSFSDVSKTFAPPLYYLLIIVSTCVVNPIFSIFVFQGIVLHRWTAKWGIITAILALCLLFGVRSYINVLGGISRVLIYTLLYIKTRTLIVPSIALMLDIALLLIIDEGFIIYRSTRGISALEQFRNEWKLGVFFLVLSAPWIIHFIYKNWPRPNQQLPYFANASR